MAVTSGFFNSVNHDRLYDAEQLSSIFDGIIIDGVYENYGNAFNVTAVTTADNMVSVGTGRAWFDHTWTLNDTPLSIAIEPASEMVVRIDAIVIDVDRRKDVRKNSIVYIKGTVAEGEPPKPTLINEEFHKQYPICYINRQPGATGPVSQSEIEILVGTDKCPIVTGILDAQQLESEFNEWWDGIRDLIGGDDPVLNLQTQIDELKAYVEGKLEGDNALMGLLEKSVADLFMSGKYDIQYSSYSGSFSAGAFLLPDGKILDAGGGGSSFTYTLYSSDGVQLSTDTKRWTAWSKPSDSGSDSRGDYVNTYKSVTLNCAQTLIRNTNFNVSEYPVTCSWSAGESLEYTKAYERSGADPIQDHMKGGVGLNTLTLSSDGIFLYEKTDMIYDSSWHYISEFVHETDDEGYFPTYLTTMRYKVLDHDPTASGAVVLAFLCGASNWSDTNSEYRRNFHNYAYKVTADGVLAGPVYAKGILPLGGKTYVKGEQGKSIYYITNSSGTPTGAWGEINESTLSMTYHESGSDAYELDFMNAYPVALYTLSEAKGVEKKERKVGESKSTVSTESVRKYFTGATNSSDGLPEGTYFAFENEDNGMLLGIGPNSTQIAIGTNGGAAILKTKHSASVPSIDITQYETRFPSYVNTSNGVYYKNGKNVYYLRRN